jgi:sigma-B regulation protein RsbU (phosphoserine phosphatase)
MFIGDTPQTAPEVVSAFHHDAPYFFLGASFITIGLLTIGPCLLRRKYDALLVWLGAFATLYGLRLWVESSLWNSSPQTNWLLSRLPAVINCLVPIPAFTFFRLAGFLNQEGKSPKNLWYSNGLFLTLAALTLVIGPWRVFGDIADITVFVLFWIMLVRSLRRKDGAREFKTVRIGVLAFLVAGLLDRTIGAPFNSKLEPFGFAVLLGCLNYVAGHRALQRDVELGEIQRELDVAQTIQRSILPDAFPPSPDFRVAARYVPMSSVAGDLYDYLTVTERQFGLFIADVSGHGVPAALIASMVKMAAISQLPNASRPADLLSGVNRALCGQTQGQFVTAAYVFLDAASRELRYSAAGHPAMLLLREGSVTEIAENGLILAAWDAATYSERAIPLEAGDRLLLYTDGLVEARNADGKLLGDNALMAAFAQTRGQDAEQAADFLIQTAKQWANSQDDDLTVVVCDCLMAEP